MICRLACRQAALLMACLATAAWAGFGTDELVTSGSPGFVGQSVTTDPPGKVHVVYSKSNTVYFREYASGAWQTEVPLTATGFNFPIAVATDPAHRVHVLLKRFATQVFTYLYRRRDANGVWGAEEVVRQLPATWTTFEAQLAIDASGNVFVDWEEGRSSPTVDTFLGYRVREESSGNWLPVGFLEAVVDGGGRIEAPRVAAQGGVDDPAAGHPVTLAHFVWWDGLNGATITYRAVKFDPDPAPGNPKLSLVGGSNLDLGFSFDDGYHFPFVIARGDKIHVVAGSIEPNSMTALKHAIGLLVTNPALAITFAPPAATGFIGADPSLAVDGAGDVHMAFVRNNNDGTPDGPIQYAAWTSANNAWGAGQVVNDTPFEPSSGTFPSIALDGTTVHVTWGTVAGTHHDLSAAGLVDVSFPAPTRQTALALADLSPNPVRDEATAEFSVRDPGRVRLQVFDLQGRSVRTLLDAVTGAGVHRVDWDRRDSFGRRVPAGVYMLRGTAIGIEAKRRFVTIGP